MNRRVVLGAAGLMLACACAALQAQQRPAMSFFVTSVGLGRGGNLGGIRGADAHCQALAQAAGAGAKTWRAYLSVTDLNGKGAINARDRIGRGPWYNANGVRIAIDVDDLHSDSANITADTAITEKGAKLPTEPNSHDILTGSTRDGRAWNYNLLDDLNLERGAMTCSNYTSDAEDQFVMLGHHDPSWSAFSYEGARIALDRIAEDVQRAGVTSIGSVIASGEFLYQGDNFSYYDAELHRGRALGAFRDALGAVGIASVGGQTSSSFDPPMGATMLGTWRSPPLAVTSARNAGLYVRSKTVVSAFA